MLPSRPAPLRLLAFAALLTLSGCGGAEDTVGPPEEPGIGTLSGVVLDGFGSPVAGAVVIAEPSGGFGATATSSATGTFTMSGLSTGSYVVTATKAGFEEAVETATVLANSESTVSLGLEPLSLPSAGTIEARYLGKSGSTMTFEVDVFVVDAAANLITGLGSADFSIGDFSGFAFNQLSVGIGFTGNNGPYSASLLLDQSGSIRTTDPNDSRVQAGKIFLDAVGAGDQVIVSAFSSRGKLPFEPLTIWGSFTSNGRSFFSVMDDLPSMESGGTPLFQAAAGMIDYTADNGPTSNRAVVIFTDGEDTQGGWTLDQVVAHANQRNVRLYTVGLSSSVDMPVLAQLADRTGGAVMWASDARQLVSMYKTLGGVLRGSVSFYRTRWTARLTNGQGWGSGGWLQSGVSVRTAFGTVWTPFYVSVP